MIDLENKFASLNVWKKNGERAPHKPLLVLLAISKYLHGSERLIPYGEIHEKLKELLMNYGPVRRSYHPELPYWYLQSDGLWEITNIDASTVRIGNVTPKSKLFIENSSSGGFPDTIYQLIKKDTKLACQIINTILYAHFPETIHEDILSALGLENISELILKGRARNPIFRENVLRAYEYRCAVCGFNARLDNILVGIEAAHIKWFQAGGPDEEINGIALCSLHHKLFDRGLFTLDDSLKIKVSEKANGSGNFEQLVLNYHGRQLKPPIRPTYYPKDIFVEWHVREVFQGPGRYL
jgi:putative restriction endonuclease